jgi:hypothetical protein
MGDISALYPQPPAPQQGMLDDPARVIGLINSMNEMRSRQAVGNAFQNAIGSDGQFDPNAALSAIKSDPNAAWGAPGAVQSLLEARGKNIANSASQFGLNVSQNGEAMRLLAGLAQDPNLTDNKVLATSAQLARMGVDPATINSYRQQLMAVSPKQRGAALGNIVNTVIGASQAATPETLVDPNSGQPNRIPHGRMNFGQGAVPVGMTPGAGEALASNQAEYTADQTKSANILASVRPLEQALPLIRKLSNTSFGPGSAEFAKIKGALTTAGIINPNTDDLKVREMTNKYLLNYVTQRQAAGHTDAARSAAIASNPNLDFTQPANIKLILNQIGMDKQEAALPLAHGGVDPSNYKTFKANYYQNHDQRAFAINSYTPEEIADLQKNLKGPERAKFNRSLQTAIKTGLVTPPSQGQ